MLRLYLHLMNEDCSVWCTGSFHLILARFQGVIILSYCMVFIRPEVFAKDDVGIFVLYYIVCSWFTNIQKICYEFWSKCFRIYINNLQTDQHTDHCNIWITTNWIVVLFKLYAIGARFIPTGNTIYSNWIFELSHAGMHVRS